MNSLILKDSSGLVKNKAIIEHLKATLDAKIGDSFKCTVLNSGLCTGVIESISENEYRLKLSEITSYQKPWINLIVAASRPQTTKKVLEHGTTFGVGMFHFYKATLTEKSYLDAKIFQNNEFNEFLEAGLSQSVIYGQLPEVKVDKFNPAKNYETDEQKFILDLNATKSFLDYKDEIDFSKTITLSIGPERGFVTEDINRFTEAGFKSVKISSSVLRVEHAVFASISQLEMLRGKY